MPSSTNTVSTGLSMRFRLCCLLIAVAATSSMAQIGVQAPAGVTAGRALTLSTSGQGDATLYLVGPASSVKRSVKLGNEVTILPEEVRAAGRYLAIVCSGTCSSTAFYVAPAEVATVAVLAHPSRVPVSQSDAISGVALLFDQFHNLVLAPQTVQFSLETPGSRPLSQVVSTRGGLAWIRIASGRESGRTELTTLVNGISTRRVVQQVASEPCHLRITTQHTPQGILVQTDPVRDCAGNPVPDGTTVSFTRVSENGRSTVDAPVKQGVARAYLGPMGPGVISVASGVTMGNEIHLGR